MGQIIDFHVMVEICQAGQIYSFREKIYERSLLNAHPPLGYVRAQEEFTT